MSPYQYVLQKVFVTLKPSSYDGVGVFALKDIPKNTSLFDPWEGETGIYQLTEQEINSLPKKLRKHIRDIFLYHPDFPNNRGTLIELTKGCHWIYTTPYYFVNSSLQEDHNFDKDTYLTVRDIKEGQEIVSNYKRFEKNKTLI